MKLKEDLLSHTTAELNYGLAHFVHEIRRPNGENYAPDSIYYLCLGIQEVSDLTATRERNVNKKGCCVSSWSERCYASGILRVAL